MRSTRRDSNKFLRSEIAQTAARLVAEGEAEDFASAKRKAAIRLGIENSRNMPDDLQVQTALITYLQFFEGESLELRLTTMRCQALAAMRVFEQFSPRLVGPVLYGSAVANSAVTLHLYTDELESVTRHLYDLTIDYRLASRRLKLSQNRHEEFPTYLVVNQGIDFELIVFRQSYFTHPPLSALDGRRYKRADTAAVEKLLARELSFVSNQDAKTPSGGSP